MQNISYGDNQNHSFITNNRSNSLENPSNFYKASSQNVHIHEPNFHSNSTHRSQVNQNHLSNQDYYRNNNFDNQRPLSKSLFIDGRTAAYNKPHSVQVPQYEHQSISRKVIESNPNRSLDRFESANYSQQISRVPPPMPSAV